MAIIDKALLESTKPLKVLPTGSGFKYECSLVKTIPECDLRHHTAFMKPFDETLEIIYEITELPGDFTKLDILFTYTAPFDLIHHRMIEKMKKLCPNDFQAINVKLINTKKSKRAFENRDFYIVHVLHSIDALDRDRSIIEYETLESGEEDYDIIKKAFKDNSWEGHFIAKDEMSCRTLWHPRLAKEFIKSPRIKFEEADKGLPPGRI